MKLLLLLLPLSLLGNPVFQMFQEHDQFLSSLKVPEQKLRLDRFDVQLGLSASGEFAIFNAGASSAVELIWQRNFPETQDGGDDIDDRIIEVDSSVDREQIYQELKNSMDVVLDLKSLRGPVKRNVLRSLQKDALKISKLIESIVTMPAVNGWYVSSFFKNYYFSSSFGLLKTLKFGVDKRVRFRFKVAHTPYILDGAELSPRQKKLEQQMVLFSHLESTDPYDVFLLKRAVTVNTFEGEIDFGVASFSAGQGVRIEFKKLKQEIQPVPKVYSFKTKLFKALHHSALWMMDPFNRYHYPDEARLSLHQIRFKFQLKKGFDFKLVNFEEASNMELHYKR